MSQYKIEKQNLEKRNGDVDKKGQATSSLVFKTVLNKKFSGVNN